MPTEPRELASVSSASNPAQPANGDSTLDPSAPPSPAAAEAFPESTRTIAIEAAAFRRLLAHLDSRKDVQNIDLMNLAGFCRNCLARWYEEEAHALGYDVDRASARERIYGMPYETWKAQFQLDGASSQIESHLGTNTVIPSASSDTHGPDEAQDHSASSNPAGNAQS